MTPKSFFRSYPEQEDTTPQFLQTTLHLMLSTDPPHLGQRSSSVETDPRGGLAARWGAGGAGSRSSTLCSNGCWGRELRSASTKGSLP